MKRLLYIIPALLLVAGCGSASQITRASQYAKLYEEKPVTLLVMPPINNSNVVEAKELLYTSISKPLAEAGYYVISPRLAMDILQAESAYDSELFFDAPLNPFKKVFGVDAVIFSIIDTWAKKGFGIETKIRYVMKSAHTGEILFDRSCDLYLDLSVNSGSGGLGALVDLVASAVTTAVTDHIEAARRANIYVFSDIPRGKYSPEYGIDGEEAAQEKDIKATVK